MKTTLKLSRPMSAIRKPVHLSQDEYNAVCWSFATKGRNAFIKNKVNQLLPMAIYRQLGRKVRRWAYIPA